MASALLRTCFYLGRGTRSRCRGSCCQDDKDGLQMHLFKCYGYNGSLGSVSRALGQRLNDLNVFVYRVQEGYLRQDPSVLL